MYNKMGNRLGYRKEEFPEIDKHVPNVIKTSSKKQICNGIEENRNYLGSM
jgi:hypothetical protein